MNFSEFARELWWSSQRTVGIPLNKEPWHFLHANRYQNERVVSAGVAELLARTCARLLLRQTSPDDKKLRMATSRQCIQHTSSICSVGRRWRIHNSSTRVAQRKHLLSVLAYRKRCNLEPPPIVNLTVEKNSIILDVGMLSLGNTRKSWREFGVIRPHEAQG